MNKSKFIYNTGKTIEEPESITGQIVEVIFRDGLIQEMFSVAENYYWRHDGCVADIIAYRVIKKGDK